MKASLNWLRSLVPGLPASPTEVAERLTRAGLEVEALSLFGEGLEQMIVAAVTAVRPHPSRSNLCLVDLDRGPSGAKTVVCGAPNVPAPGGLVCYAEIGATLPALHTTISAREIGGVRSEGMLLSEAEMGIGEDASGIVVLPSDTAAPGTPLPLAVPAVSDVIFDIGVSPNRPDALGHIGIAREAAALFELPFSPPRADSPSRISSGNTADHVTIEVQDFERCPHYGGLVVVDAVVQPSPLWLRCRLASLGVRSLSNIVDITNLVMLEYGHPMHAFDLELLRGRRIVVRRAKEGEVMKTLDGIERRCVADDLLICDGEGPVAMGGVMGGENTEIRPNTRRVLFECAYFDPRGVRRTARRHGLHTESSHRFERGVDPGDIHEALAHAGSLATRLANASAVPGALHVRRDPLLTTHVQLRHRRLEALLGTEVPLGEVKALLTRLGFDVTNLHQGADHGFLVAVPSWRPDISREADLIEEVARIRGLDSIPTSLPPIRPQPPRDCLVLEGRVRSAAVGLGLDEAVTYSFVSPSALEAVGAPPPSVRLLNPLSEDRCVMRTSLLPGLLETIARARRHGERSARLFTLGSLFLPGLETSKLPEERPTFAAVLTGTRDLHLGRAEDIDVFDAKGLGTEIIARVARLTALQVAPYSASALLKWMHPRACGRLLVGALEVGRFGMLHPDLADAAQVAPATAVVEIDLTALRQVCGETPKYKPIPRLPAASRDIALLVHDSTSAGDVESLIKETAGELCESVEIFDVFRGKEIPDGYRSLAFHVVYRDPKAATDPEHARTLTDDDVDRRHAEVVKTARERLGARLR